MRTMTHGHQSGLVLYNLACCSLLGVFNEAVDCMMEAIKVSPEMRKVALADLDQAWIKSEIPWL